jgi:hypothetical protein
MTQISLTVKNADLVRQGLQNLGAEIPKVGRLQIYKTMQRIQRRMKEYWTSNIPPELPSYQRTGTLAAGYSITSKTNGYTLRNPVSYTKYVVGNAYGLEQAWMHAKPGRHTKLRDVTEEEAQVLPDEVLAEISMVARREGFK